MRNKKKVALIIAFFIFYFLSGIFLLRKYQERKESFRQTSSSFKNMNEPFYSYGEEPSRNEETLREREGSAMVPYGIQESQLLEGEKRGMTRGKSLHDDHLNIDLVSCHGRPRIDNGTEKGASCDPYYGDTSCTEYLPILCLDAGNYSRPNYAITGRAHAMSKEFYRGWAGGHIKLTEPVQGSTLTSIDVANQICRDFFGDGYRMAEHHDGKWVLGMDESNFFDETWPSPAFLSSGGWTWFAYGNISGQVRFWVHINDQPGNCWN